MSSNSVLSHRKQRHMYEDYSTGTTEIWGMEEVIREHFEIQKKKKLATVSKCMSLSLQRSGRYMVVVNIDWIA